MAETPPTEIWITSVGVVTGFGVGMQPLLEGLEANEGAGAVPLEGHVGRLPISVVSAVIDPLSCPEGFEGDRKAALAFAAADQLCVGSVGDLDCAVFLGTGLSSVTPTELETDLYPHLADGAFQRASLSADLSERGGAPRRHMPARVAHSLSSRLGLEGPVQTCFSACAAGAQAVASAVTALRRGEVRRAIAGGHDAMIHPLGALSFLLLDTLCSSVCRPFDRRRDGFMMGEGAAVFLLERPDAAIEAGRRPLARVLGVGTSVDAHAVTAPHPEGRGALLTMQRALEDAALPPGAVDQVNAHGTGTPVGDRAESLAISRLLPGETPVCSIKGAVGHTIAAAGAVELAATVGCMQAGFTPGTVHCRQPDPACPVQVQLESRSGAPGLVLSNSFGFGGQNAALLVAHPDWQR